MHLVAFIDSAFALFCNDPSHLKELLDFRGFICLIYSMLLCCYMVFSLFVCLKLRSAVTENLLNSFHWFYELVFVSLATNGKLIFVDFLVV